MIFEREEDENGAFYRLGMIERAALTLDNYASSNFGARFYTEEFLKGFCEQRNRIIQNANKTSTALIFVTTILALFDSISGTTQVFGFTISLPDVGRSALCVYLALTFFAAVNAFLDQLIIDRMFNVLGERIGVYSFQILLLNYTANNLWTLASSPKYYGLKSQFGHEQVLKIQSTFMVLFGFAFVLYPIIVYAFTASKIATSNPSSAEMILLTVAFVMLLYSILNITLFSINYKFRPSGLPEPAEPYIPEDFLDLGHPINPKTSENGDQEEDTGR